MPALKTNHPDIPPLKLMCMPSFKRIDGSMHNSPCLHSKQPSTLGDLRSSRGGPRNNRGLTRVQVIRPLQGWLHLGLMVTLEHHGSPRSSYDMFENRPAPLSQGGAGGGRGWCPGGGGGRGWCPVSRPDWTRLRRGRAEWREKGVPSIYISWESISLKWPVANALLL